MNQNPVIPEAKKDLISFDKKDRVFALLAVLVSVGAACWGLFGETALGYGIVSLSGAVLFFSYFRKGARFRPLTLLCGGLAVALSAVFILTTNQSVRFFAAVAAFLLMIVALDGMKNGPRKGNRETVGGVYTAFATAKNVPLAARSFLAGNKDKRTAGKVLLGLVCAVPVLMVVVPLLVSSDVAFRNLTELLFGNLASHLFEVALGLGLGVLVVTYGVSLRYGKTKTMKKGSFRGIDTVYLVSFLSAIALCYLLYLFSQLAYFFSAFRGLLPEGEVSFSSYARNGFFEMCVIAVINLALVLLTLFLAKKAEGRLPLPLKILCSFVAVFTLIIIASAISKMLLYIAKYHLTVLRLTTSAFMLFLAVVFLAVILRIYTDKVNLFLTSLIAAACTLLVLGTVNVNAVCAKYNYEKHLDDPASLVDVSAFMELGDEGIPYLTLLAEEENLDIAFPAWECLNLAIRYEYFDVIRLTEADIPLTLETLEGNESKDSLTEFSLPRKRAYDSLHEFLERHHDFREEFQKIRKKVFDSYN